MALVSCKCGCGQKIETAFAYKVPFNGVTFKFLNEKHYLAWSEKFKIKKKKLNEDENLNKIYDLFINIFGNDVHARDVVKTELDKWLSVTTIEKITGYITENTAFLKKTLQKKEIDTVFCSIKYLSAIIIKEAPKYEKENIVLAGVDEQVAKENKCAGACSKKRKSLAELEAEL